MRLIVLQVMVLDRKSAYDGSLQPVVSARKEVIIEGLGGSYAQQQD